jgi:hypothetical protein
MGISGTTTLDNVLSTGYPKKYPDTSMSQVLEGTEVLSGYPAAKRLSKWVLNNILIQYPSVSLQGNLGYPAEKIPVRTGSNLTLGVLSRCSFLLQL